MNDNTTLMRQWIDQLNKASEAYYNGLSTEGTRTMTFTGTLFSLFAENGDGVFNIGVKLLINPDENYTL